MKLTRLELKIDFARWTADEIEDMDDTEERFRLCMEDCLELFMQLCPSLKQGRISVLIGRVAHTNIGWDTRR